MMRTVRAKVLDKTHLELSRPIPHKQGADIQILINDDEDLPVWKTASRKRFMKAYDKSDAIYDKL